MSQQVESAQARSANLSNADREVLVLLQVVTQLGVDTDPHEIDVHRGVAGRQIGVSIASFDSDDPRVRELHDVRERLAAFPWDRLAESRGRDDTLRREAMALVGQSEERINTLRSEQEKTFYAITRSSLAANQHGQFTLAALVTLVLGLGIAGITVVLRRSRSDVARAFAALKGEVDERRVAEEALRASEGRFRSLVQRASDLTIVTDDRGVVTYVSPAVEALVGYRPEDFLELPLLVHVEPEERADVATTITLLAERPGLVRTVELRLRTARRPHPLGRGGVPEPGRRPGRRRPGVERPRRHRAQGAGERAQPPRPPRPADRPAQPGAAAAAARRDAGPHRAGAPPPVHGRRRPRRVQERQRHPGPRGRRRAAAGGRAAVARRACATATSPRGWAATSSPS